MAAHRYWRLRQVSGPGCMSSTNIDFKTVLGGSNVAVGGTGLQSSCYSGDCAGYGAYRAIDGSGLFHSDCTGNGQWAGYDFGAGNDIEITAAGWQERGAYPEQSPNALALDWSDDGAAWTQVTVVEGLDWYSGADYKEFSFIPQIPFEDAVNLDFTGELESFTIGEGATSLDFALWGGGGHGGQYGGGNYGGGGGYVGGSIPVSGGDVVTLQVAEGGRNAAGDGITRGKGGWPDGGHGSRGDTWGGGGGGSSRLWLNGVLMAVAGGGGGAAGYSGNGGGGGGQQGADGSSAPIAGVRPGRDDDAPYGWKIGRSIADTGAIGRTGGFGGYMLTGTGDDSGGGGGGYYGGGGSGGDGRSGGGGLSWLHASVVSPLNMWGNNGGTPGNTGNPNYIAGRGIGKISNNQDVGGSGLASFTTDVGAPIAGGVFSGEVWNYIFDRPADSYWNVDLQGKTVRFAVNADAFVGTGEQIRISLRGAGSGTRIAKMFVGIGVPFTGFYEGVGFADTPTPILFGGSPNIIIPTDTLIHSDVVDFEIPDMLATTRIVFSIYFSPGSESHIFIGGSGDGYDFVVNDKAGGRNGDYRLFRCNGDVSEDLMIGTYEEWQYWQMLESLQTLGSGGGGGPDPEETRRRLPIVVC